MRFTILLILAVTFVVAGAALAQSPPQENHRKAFLVAQTHGPPPSYTLDDVTVLLSRRSSGDQRGVTYSGSGRTVYVRSGGEKGFGEKTAEVSGDELFAVLEEIYRAGFFSMGESYTERVYIKREPSGEVATHFAELRPNPPILSLTVRIGEFEKSVKAVDSRGRVSSFGTPEKLLDLADFIEDRPVVLGLRKEIGR